jgi:anaerobic ribonucleoside-triphosphate reductase
MREQSESKNQTPLSDTLKRQPCEVWTRVMGYHRPVESFNIGKKAEHRQRRFFRETPAPVTC